MSRTNLDSAIFKAVLIAALDGEQVTIDLIRNKDGKYSKIIKNDRQFNSEKHYNDSVLRYIKSFADGNINLLSTVDNKVFTLNTTTYNKSLMTAKAWNIVTSCCKCLNNCQYINFDSKKKTTYHLEHNITLIINNDILKLSLNTDQKIKVNNPIPTIHLPIDITYETKCPEQVINLGYHLESIALSENSDSCSRQSSDEHESYDDKPVISLDFPKFDMSEFDVVEPKYQIFDPSIDPFDYDQWKKTTGNQYLTWRQSLIITIKQIMNQKTGFFTLRNIYKHLNEVQSRLPPSDRKTPPCTAREQIQILRNKEYVTFVNMKGAYIFNKSHWYHDFMTNDYKSEGENVVAKRLADNLWSFINEKKFDGLKDKNKLSFDFYLVINGVRFLIEVDGAQHFRAIAIFGGMEKFLITQKHDRMKEDAMSTHPQLKNMYLLRISNINGIDSHDLDEMIDTIKRLSGQPFMPGNNIHKFYNQKHMSKLIQKTT
jgi:hypothetical protein